MEANIYFLKISFQNNKKTPSIRKEDLEIRQWKVNPGERRHRKQSANVDTRIDRISYPFPIDFRYIPRYFIPVSWAKNMAAEPVFVSRATTIPSKFQSFTRNISDKSQAKLPLCSRVRAYQKHSMDDKNNVYKQLG